MFSIQIIHNNQTTSSRVFINEVPPLLIHTKPTVNMLPPCRARDYHTTSRIHEYAYPLNRRLHCYLLDTHQQRDIKCTFIFTILGSKSKPSITHVYNCKHHNISMTLDINKMIQQYNQLQSFILITYICLGSLLLDLCPADSQFFL